MKGALHNFKTTSQNFKILEYLKTGKTLTCLEAANLGFGFNLRSRISNLKKAGYDIVSKKIVNGSGSYHAEYHLNV